MTDDPILTAGGRPPQQPVGQMALTRSMGLRAKVSHLVAPFVVVSNPGTLFERIEDYCSTMKGAIEAKSCYDDPCDVMRVLPSGRLTTEF